MKNTKLIRTLSSLEINEIQAFRDFVASPFFNKRPQSIRLLDILIPYTPAFPAEQIEKQTVFKQLFPGKPFALQKLKDESKLLFGLLRQFLAHSALNHHPIQSDLLALQELRKRKVEGVFEAQWRALERKLDATNIKNEDHFYYRFQLEMEANHAYGQQEVRVANNSLTQATEALDRFYLLQKIRASAELLNRQKILGTSADIPFAHHLISFLEQNEAHFADTPTILMYQLLFKTFTATGGNTAYHELVKQLMNQVDMLKKEEARALFKYCQNYCVARINAGESHFLAEHFRLYRFQLDHQLLENLSHASYSNIIATGLRLGENKWVHQFMQEQVVKLSPEFREAVYHYNLALYHYSLQDFRPALPLLQAIQFTDGFYALSAKLLLCRMYFEMEEQEALFYLIDAFQRHLSRAKDLAPIHRVPYQQFLRFLKQTSRLRERAPYLDPPLLQQRRLKLRQAIEGADVVAHREWLLGLGI